MSSFISRPLPAFARWRSSLRSTSSQLRFASTQAGELRKTTLYDFHIDPAHGGKMVPFAGFSMPLNYAGSSPDFVPGGALAEHHHVRSKAGLFDVGHMVQSTFAGPGAEKFLSTILPAGLGSLGEFKSTLSVILNRDGGILDDCIITRWGPESFYLVTNAGRRDEDLAWLQEQQASWQGPSFEWNVLENCGLVALQGPTSAASLGTVLPPDVASQLPKITFGGSFKADTKWGEIHIARGGYTGEDGFEISVPESGSSTLTSDFCRTLIDVPDVKLAGLGARDSLRLEAGMCLYGNDLDESVGVGEAGLGWVVGKERRGDDEYSFIGKDRTLKELVKNFEGIERKRVGLTIEAGAPGRSGAKIYAPTNPPIQIGSVTSGLPSPSLKQNIAMGYINTAPVEDAVYFKKGAQVLVDVRGKMRKAEVVLMPWIKVGYYRG